MDCNTTNNWGIMEHNQDHDRSERFGDLKSKGNLFESNYASMFEAIEDDEEYSYSYDVSGYVVGRRLKKGCETEVLQIDSTSDKDDALGCSDDEKSESSVKFVPKFYLFDDNSGPDYVNIDSDEEVEEPQIKEASFEDGDNLEYHEHLLENSCDTERDSLSYEFDEELKRDNNLSYSFNASGYVVGCRLKKGCESEEVQSDANCNGYNSESEDSVNFSSNFSLLYQGWENEVEEPQVKEASFDDGDSLEYHEHLLEKSSCDTEHEFEERKSNNLSYSFDASGYFVGCRVNKGYESEEVQSDAKCNESESGDSVKFSMEFPWLYQGCDEDEDEEIEEAVFDNFDMMLINAVSEADQTSRPNLKRKAEDAEIGEGQIVSCLMAGRDCPWRDSKGQLRKRVKSLKH